MQLIFYMCLVCHNNILYYQEDLYALQTTLLHKKHLTAVPDSKRKKGTKMLSHKKYTQLSKYPIPGHICHISEC